jgi:hypothetical protein
MSGEGDLLAKFLGWALMALGILIMSVSGLCSGVGLMFVLNQPSMLPVVLIFGGVPFGIGLVCWWAGRAVMPKPKFLPRHSVGDQPPTDPPAKPPTVS